MWKSFIAPAVGALLAVCGTARAETSPAAAPQVAPAPVPMQREATRPSTYNIDNERLDGRTFEPGRGNIFTCLISGTYDPNAWDKNRYVGQPRSAQVAGYETAGPRPVTTVEVVQWSWAERARCQQALGTSAANATAGLALAYLFAQDEHQARPKSISDKDLGRLGVLVLLPVVMDDLRAVGPTRRYYTSAVLGTSLITWRNDSLLHAYESLAQVHPYYQNAFPPCFIQPPSGFALKNADVAGIESLQARVIVDIDAYNDWCAAFEVARNKVWASQNRVAHFTASFQRARSAKWKEYSTLINTNGYQKQATTARVLHKFITLPATLVASIADDEKSEYELDDQAKLNGADAVELPVMGGDFAVTHPQGDIGNLAQTLRNDLRKLSSATNAFIPSGKKEKAAETGRQLGDQRLVRAVDGSGYFDDAMKNGLYWSDASALVAEINDWNTRRFIILDVASGKAYLSDHSVEQIKSSSPAETPAPAVEPAPAEAEK